LQLTASLVDWADRHPDAAAQVGLARGAFEKRFEDRGDPLGTAAGPHRRIVAQSEVPEQLPGRVHLHARFDPRGLQDDP
jgi:hypothetical protein